MGHGAIYSELLGKRISALLPLHYPRLLPVFAALLLLHGPRPFAWPSSSTSRPTRSKPIASSPIAPPRFNPPHIPWWPPHTTKFDDSAPMSTLQSAAVLLGSGLSFWFLFRIHRCRRLRLRLALRLSASLTLWLSRWRFLLFLWWLGLGFRFVHQRLLELIQFFDIVLDLFKASHHRRVSKIETRIFAEVRRQRGHSTSESVKHLATGHSRLDILGRRVELRELAVQPRTDALALREHLVLVRLPQTCVAHIKLRRTTESAKKERYGEPH